MSLRKVMIQCLVTLNLVSFPAAAQVQHQPYHPPQNASEYIRILEDPSRDEWQQPDKVVTELGIEPGQSVADLGSGPGYFTLRLARAVGPEGRVYAIDISRPMLEFLQKQAAQEHIGNIQTIVAEPHDPRLPPASMDMIFICDTLHHIPDRTTYYPLLWRALKPAGRLVNIDFQKQDLPVGPPVEMKISRTQMIQEAEAAGFRLDQQLDFLKYQYFLVFRR